MRNDHADKEKYTETLTRRSNRQETAKLYLQPHTNTEQVLTKNSDLAKGGFVTQQEEITLFSINMQFKDY